MTLPLKLSDIAAVLGCDKSTASRLQSGVYGRDRPNSELLGRYSALVLLVEEAKRQSRGDLTAICRACPREDCTGCRLAEI